MSLLRPVKAWARYHREAFDLDGARHRARDIRILLDAARRGPVGAPPPVYPRQLRASALSAYIYGGGALVAYGGVLFQLATLSASAVVTGAWALAAVAFTVQALSAAARHWRLRTGREGGGIEEFLDGPGPHWPRLRR
jgi:hypothetical protein